MDRFLNIIKKRDASNIASCSSKEETKQKYRKYGDSYYLDFGFTCMVVGNEHPQCVTCFKVLDTESMLPKMKRHLETVHGSLLNKPREYFSRKVKEMTSKR